MDNNIEEVIVIIEQVLEKKGEKSNLITTLQQMIWNNNESDDERWVILRDLAYDLDFYESKSTVRQEDASFFGDDRLEMEIKSALKKLNYYS